MLQRERILSQANIASEIEQYLQCVAQLENPLQGLSGIKLLTQMKRGRVGRGPYPNVSFFEAANRIMSDLVIYYGVKKLLETPHLFYADNYRVELGNEKENDFDITAGDEKFRVIGEAFNVSKAFFQSKKSGMLAKLRTQKAEAKLLLFNKDAVQDPYAPKLDDGFYFIKVDVDRQMADIYPEEGYR